MSDPRVDPLRVDPEDEAFLDGIGWPATQPTPSPQSTAGERLSDDLVARALRVWATDVDADLHLDDDAGRASLASWLRYAADRLDAARSASPDPDERINPYADHDGSDTPVSGFGTVGARLDVERLIGALAAVDHRIAVEFPEEAVEMESDAAALGRRSYAEAVAAEYLALLPTTTEPRSEEPE